MLFFGYSSSQVRGLIEDAQTVEVVPVIHAQWMQTEKYGIHAPSARYSCSNCGRRTGHSGAKNYKICPKCGAYMDCK